MNCPRCGEVCSCRSEPPPAELAQSTPARGDADVSGATGSRIAVETAVSDDEGGQDDSAWREELAARLTRYRSRHKMRPPRYPSLRLPFDGPGCGMEDRSQPAAGGGAEFEPLPAYDFDLDGAVARVRSDRSPEPTSAANSSAAKIETPNVNYGAKIIEFPRFAWAPPPPPPDQLAEPVSDRPRILEVPEVTPPPPALGGITIEPSQVREVEKRPGIDFPLQSASFARRVIAAGTDGLIITSASALFGFIFWKVTGFEPPRPQILGLAAGIPCLFWIIYQYLLVVYAGRTPGLRAVGLELARFDGSPASRSVRRWRVLASYLSAASVGMGYLWVFLDEDALCWHDRITHTYLSPKKRDPHP